MQDIPDFHSVGHIFFYVFSEEIPPPQLPMSVVILGISEVASSMHHANVLLVIQTEFLHATYPENHFVTGGELWSICCIVKLFKKNPESNKYHEIADNGEGIPAWISRLENEITNQWIQRYESTQASGMHAQYFRTTVGGRLSTECMAEDRYI